MAASGFQIELHSVYLAPLATCVCLSYYIVLIALTLSPRYWGGNGAQRGNRTDFLIFVRRHTCCDCKFGVVEDVSYLQVFWLHYACCLTQFSFLQLTEDGKYIGSSR